MQEVRSRENFNIGIPESVSPHQSKDFNAVKYHVTDDVPDGVDDYSASN